MLIAGGAFGLFAPIANADPSGAAGLIVPPARRPPGAVGKKFYPSGNVREWPGNTIICPVDPSSALHQTLKDVQEAAMAEPVMRKFALLPTSSLHMTLFEGVDLDHRRPPFWPSSSPSDSPLSVVDKWFQAQLADFHTGGGRFRMRPDTETSANDLTAFTLHLTPADPRQDAQLKALRDRLSTTLQIRAPHHDQYRFHITLGYLIQWLSPSETTKVRQLYEGWFLQIAKAAPEFDIGPPVFCTFRDMFAFTPVLTLKD